MLNKQTTLNTFLTNNGWKKYEVYSPVYTEKLHRLWCKKVDVMYPCTTSNKLYICLDYTGLDVHDNSHENITVKIRGEIDGHTWYTLEAYSMSLAYFIKHAETVEQKLCSAWDSLHTQQ